ncbi:Isopentenyl-diphosphate Delta-isomerase [bacterium HR28]|nr:Isopentenyl-diphosphate Delta-isomerase [bacterium HR28]
MAGTTDPQGELFDVLTPEGERTGLTVTRGVAHRSGLWHAAFHLWVAWREGAEIFVLLQRRSLTKDTMAGRIDVSVGGHFRAGEYDPQRLRQGADREPVLRELYEELGLQADPRDLRWVGTRWSQHQEQNTEDYEIQELFLWLLPAPPHTLMPDPQEVAQVLAVPLAVLADLLTGALPSAEARVLWDGTGRMPADSKTVVTLADLVPGRRAYWRAMLKLIESAVLGRPLAVLTLRSRGADEE